MGWVLVRGSEQFGGTLWGAKAEALLLTFHPTPPRPPVPALFYFFSRLSAGSVIILHLDVTSDFILELSEKA